ncbi:hypothetical protein [Methylocaldum sp.]|uniref:hypothetical protein n=1 Tax=Methylocaldum sp. TaxID=1969727 RepID=UPI002D3A6E4F|nr:hypothetical protein [Methylocaldum sp.]HYE34527.1 hypothetical protein [Methylocaldum sp.]
MEKNESVTKYRLRVRIREFKIPPIREGLVVGRRAAIGCHAIRKSLDLLMVTPFAHIELDDPVISDIIVRESVLRRVPQQQLIEFVLQRIKPFMDETEILHLDLETELIIEEQF